MTLQRLRSWALGFSSKRVSPVLATTIGLAVYGVLFLPLVLASGGQRSRFVAAFYVTVTLGMAVYQTGFFQQSSLTPVPPFAARVVPSGDAQCQKIVQLMQESDLRVDRPDQAAPRLIGSGADQVPEQVREVLIDCWEQAENVEDLTS